MKKLYLEMSFFIGGCALFALSSCGNEDNLNVNSNNTDDVGIINNATSHSDYFKVSYDTNGHGKSPKTEAVDKGMTATMPQNPKDEGYRFKGWYLDKELTTPYIFSNEVTKDITLYAKWDEYKGVPYDTDKTPTIYLAGDSTVQTYSDDQYIGGWGQYFSWFFDEDINIVNAARGGRSTRSFINEDRLFQPTDGNRYSFSENGGKSIEETIEAGDYLFVQFGHNDDDTKTTGDNFTSMPDRMVPLGEPDSNGIYPTILPSDDNKASTNELPTEYLDLLEARYPAATDKTNHDKVLNVAKNEIAKYGDDYYQYGNGTYKGYLKMYIDFARSKGATPVLVTPVARVSFDSNGNIKSGPGLHGDDFAYVKAVKQLAEEEGCLLIDNFSATKEMLEVSTKEFADFLMALVPNTLNNGEWPMGYDSAYNNPSAGFTKIEGTHYNKYGAYLTAAHVAEEIINYDKNGITSGKDEVEYFNFVDHILNNPFSYINPSNRLSISKANQIEALFTEINVTDPEREYVKAEVAIKAIEDLKANGSIDSINSTNYLSWIELCKEARNVYESLNYDLRRDVTNINDLIAYEQAALAARPEAYKTIVLSSNDFVDLDTKITIEDHEFTFGSAIVEYNKKASAFKFNNKDYEATTKSIRLAGNSSGNTQKYVEFSVTGKCEITLVAVGGGDASRYITLTDTNKKEFASYEISPSQTLVTNTISEAGTYRIGSKGSNIDLFYIIIEYYND